MTNGEKYKTVQERAEAFYSFCEDKEMCAKCPLEHEHQRNMNECRFAWLDLEAEEEEKPETIDDVIKDMEKAVKMMRKKESEGATLLDVSVIFDKFLNRIIAAHNRVAKAVKESEAKE